MIPLINRAKAEDIVLEGILEYAELDPRVDDLDAESIAKQVVQDLFTHNRQIKSPGDLMQILTD